MARKSCYILEFSVLPGAARHAEGHAYPTLAAIHTWLTRVLVGGPDDEIDGLALTLLVGGATLGLWVVQHGKFERFIDLRPWLTLVARTGAEIRCDDAQAIAALKQQHDQARAPWLAIVIDIDRLTSELPALTPPLLRPGQALAGTFDPALEPASGTYLRSGEFEYGSWDLETGDQLDEETEDE